MPAPSAPSARGRGARARPPRLRELIDGWGGVTIAYRRRLIDAPSYTLNHEEVDKALEEGIRFAEGLTPTAIEVDERGPCARRSGWQRGRRQRRGDAAGARRAGRGGHPAQHGAGARGCRAVRLRRPVFPGRRRAAAQPVKPERLAKPKRRPGAAADLRGDGRAVSFFGDLHPSFAGNVVKAMGERQAGLAGGGAHAGPAARRGRAANDSAFVARMNRSPARRACARSTG